MKRFVLPLAFLFLSSCGLPSLKRSPLDFLTFLRFFSGPQFTGHSIGGAVSGLLAGTSVTLTNNQESVTVSADGNFTFPTKLSSGQSYDVSFVTNGAGLSCTITNAQGVVQSSNITNVSITCGLGANFYEVGVNVSGLSGTISVQYNGAETLNIATTGLTKFTTLTSTGSNYTVTITSQPAATICSFDDPALTVGTMAAANVTLFITCVTGYIVGGNIHPTPGSDLGTSLIARKTFLKTRVGSYPINTAGGAGAVSGGAVATASATATRFNGPTMIVTDGNFVYVADTMNAVIRKIDKSNGTTTILAGGNSGGGTVCPGTITTNCQDGVGTAAQFNGIVGLTTNGNNLFVLESAGRRIRKVNLATSVVSTFAGSGNPASADNPSGILASFNNPSGITLFNGNLYVVDRGNCTIRVVNPISTAVTTLAGGPTLCSFADNPTGTNARFLSPLNIVGLGGFLYVSDIGVGGGHKIRRISLTGTNAVDTIAGDGVQASTDGIGTAAQFNDPHGLTTDGTNLFISEWSGHKIRHLNLSTGKVTTLVGNIAGYSDSTGGMGLLNFPGYLMSDGINIYISDTGNHSLRYLEHSELLRYTFDGNTNDSIGTNHGLVTGAPSPTMDENGLVGGAYEFQGSGEIIQSTSNISPTITENLTISAWVYPGETVGDQFIFHNGLGGNNGYGLVLNGTGNPRSLYISLDPAGISGNTTMKLPLNQWSHIVLRRSYPNWHVFINGKQDALTFSSNPNAPANTFKVGDGGNALPFKGKISDVRFFNGALDSDDIQRLGIQIPAGLITYFPFNGNAKDYGSAGNHLTNTGAAPANDRSGHPNGAYYFNGASFMQRLSPNGLPAGISPRTICAWFNKSSSAGEYIVGYGTFVNLQGNGLVVSDTVTGMFGVADDVTTFHEGFRNQWMHLCGTFDSPNIKVYENGVVRATGSKAWSTVPGPSLEVGRRLDGLGNFSGDLDEIRIYDRILSDAEIRVLSGYYPTQVSSWNQTPASSSLKLFLMPEAASFGPGLCLGGANCVGIVDDRSGNGFHVSQGLGIQQPSFDATGINGSKSLRFTDVTGAFLSRACTPELNTATNTIFAVFIELNTSGSDGIFHNGMSGKLLYLPNGVGNQLSLFDLQGGTERLISNAGYSIANEIVLMSLDYNGTSGNIYKGGSVVSSTSLGVPSYNCSSGNLDIGRFFWGGPPLADADYLEGYLGDLIYFDQALSTSNRHIVECYLSNKYNLRLSHPCP